MSPASRLKFLPFLYYGAAILLFVEVANGLLWYFDELPPVYVEFLQEKLSTQTYGLILAITLAIGVWSFGSAHDAAKALKPTGTVEEPVKVDDKKQAEEKEKQRREEQRKRDEQEARQKLQELRAAVPYPGEILSKATASSKSKLTLSLQLLLAEAGYPASPDGNFGIATEQAVLSAQTSMGIKTDGKVGAETWNALVEKVIASGKEKQLLDLLRPKRAIEATGSPDIKQDSSNPSIPPKSKS